jgi:N-acetylmuramoyl-L-alanine amidase
MPGRPTTRVVLRQGGTTRHLRRMQNLPRRLTLAPQLPTAPSLQEIDVLARTIWGEARGEGPLGQIAVAWVILNRARADIRGDGKPDWWGEGIIGVACRPWQFSCWNADDPNLPKMRAVGSEDAAFRLAYLVAVCTSSLAFDLAERQDRHLAAAIRSSFADPTDGAVAYMTERLFKSNPPDWAKGREPQVRIGAHVFWRDIF